jgi:hypothetical protein
MIGWTPEQIEQRNEQYRRQEMSNIKATQYNLSALENGQWSFKMMHFSKEHLENIGKSWVDGGMCDGYTVVEVQRYW